jgi:hypothetical protein
MALPTPNPPAGNEGGACRKSQDGEHLWDLRRAKHIRVYLYGFWQCLLCRNDAMTVEPMPGSPNGHDN